MSKTWETLFHLSSFMKYLLTETLPEERLEAPSYVLDSLYDLLNVTSALIEKINSGLNENMKVKNQLAERSAEVILSRRSNKGIENRTARAHLKNNDSISDFLTDKGKAVCKEISNLVSTDDDISEEFMKLSKEMHNGRPFGHYCKPCDLVILAARDWDNHMADVLHIYLKDNHEIKHGSCVYCKLIIFASYKDANKLFKYHEIDHHPDNNKKFLNKENSFKTQNNKKSSVSMENRSSISMEQDFVKSNSDVPARVTNVESNSSYETSGGISPIFIELDKQMHSGKESGFYCHVCDKAFESVHEWNKHFKEVAVHRDQRDRQFEMCESCGLVVFAIPSILKLYKSHHLCGHYCFKEDKKSNFKGSLESLQSTTLSQISSHSNKYNAKSNPLRNKYVYDISQHFKNFNERIHSHNLHDHFYCRPCNATLNPDEWKIHSVNKKHLELMASRKFKNYQGICTYCSLTIIGTKDTVKYYMEFHFELHKKVPSYDVKRVPTPELPHDFTTNKIRRKFRPKRTSPNPASAVDDEEEKSDIDEKEIISNTNELTNPISSDVSGECSWYTTSRDEKLHSWIRQLIESRMDQKSTSIQDEQFVALCMICEFKTDSGFVWHDHISGDGHRHKMTPQDRVAAISELNISLAGNINVLEKYNTLVKGNLSFINN